MQNRENSQQVEIAVGPTWHDLAAVAGTPLMGIAVGVVLLLAVFSGEGQVPIFSLIIGGVPLVLGVILTVWELWDWFSQLGRKIIVTNQDVQFVRPGKEPLSLPKNQLTSLQVTDVLLKARFTTSRLTRVDAQLAAADDFLADHPEASGYLDQTDLDRLIFTIPVGRGDKLRNQVDQELQATGLASYLGIQQVIEQQSLATKIRGT